MMSTESPVVPDPSPGSSPRDSSRALVREGVFDAVKIGGAETYLGAFGVFLGGTPLQVGTLATLPPLVGALANSLGVRIVEQFHSRREALTRVMRLQALLLIPMAAVPVILGHGWYAVTSLVALAILYQVTIGVISPIWSSLVGDLIPPQARGQFFGHRNRWMAIITFSALLSAGGIIQTFATFGATAYGFLCVFLVAAASRMISAGALKDIEDPSLHVPEDSKFTFWQFIVRARHSNFVRFVFFVSCMNFAVALSGPYYAMYMLRDLSLSYLEYTCILAAAIVAQFVVMRSWGALSDEHGNRKVMKVCGWLAAWNPVLWTISGKVWFLVFVQFYSGFCWAGFNLAAANFVFDAVTPAKRARCIAYQAIINGTLVFLGSQVGGMIATKLPPALASHVGVWVPPSPFLAIFLLSAVVRLLVMKMLFPTFKEVRTVGRIRSHEMLVRVANIRPLWGATFAYVTGRAGPAGARRRKSD